MSEFLSMVVVRFPIAWLLGGGIIFLVHQRFEAERFEKPILLSLSLLCWAVGIMGLFPMGIQHILLTAFVVALGWSLRVPFVDIVVGMIAQKELRIGQWICIDRLEGQIVDKSWRELFLKTDEGSLMRIPYSMLHDQAFEVSDSKLVRLVVPLPEGMKATQAIERICDWMPHSPWSKESDWSVTWEEGIVIKVALFFPSDKNEFQKRIFKLLAQIDNKEKS